MGGFFILIFFYAVDVRANEVSSKAPPEALPLINAQKIKDSFKYVLNGQATTVTQNHPFTPALSYSQADGLGLLDRNETKTSLTATIFSGVRLSSTTEIYFNPEVIIGSGVSSSHGIAGFPNGEVYRVSTPDPKLNLSRLYLKQTFNIGDEKEEIAEGTNQVETTYSQQRITLVVGKFSLNDFFDNNSYSHDPRTQFLNWSLMDNGAWDYAADMRGYTLGFMVEYNQSDLAIRFAMATVPTRANQMPYDHNILQAHGDNLELEYRYQINANPGALRFLVFMNHAHMGDYKKAVQLSQLITKTPDITQTRSYTIKYGIGVNWEQALTSRLGIFSRWGWNDGKTETWAFTEVDATGSLGLSWQPWQERDDRFGVAFIHNELSEDHKDYIKAGGRGFMIGEGGLNYSPEQIMELYYSLQLKSFSASADLQWVHNAGYNADRKDVPLAALRLHYDF